MNTQRSLSLQEKPLHNSPYVRLSSSYEIEWCRCVAFPWSRPKLDIQSRFSWGSGGSMGRGRVDLGTPRGGSVRASFSSSCTVIDDHPKDRMKGETLSIQAAQFRSDVPWVDWCWLDRVTWQELNLLWLITHHLSLASLLRCFSNEIFTASSLRLCFLTFFHCLILVTNFVQNLL